MKAGKRYFLRFEGVGTYATVTLNGKDFGRHPVGRTTLTLDVTMEELKNMTYQETAYAVMKQFLTDFTEEELKHCIDSAYDSKFDTEVIAPLVKVGDVYHLELFHGATIAFKDMALSILPHLMTTSAKKNHVTKDIVILTATSGDTGKAAMAGFADVPGTKIIVFYPKNGVSRIECITLFPLHLLLLHRTIKRSRLR